MEKNKEEKTKKEQIKDRRKKILEMLKANPKITQQEISQELKVHIRTIKGDFKWLKDQKEDIGNKQSEEQKKKLEQRRKLKLEQEKEQELERKKKALEEAQGLPKLPLNKKAVQSVMFLCGMGAGGKTINEILEKKYSEYITSRTSAFRSLIPYMSEHNLLKKEGKFLASATIYITVLPDDYAEILSFAAYCLAKDKEDGRGIYETALRYLHGKGMIFHSKQDSMLDKLPTYIQTLKKNQADKEPVSFNYKEKKIHFFYLGFVAYSSEKDAVYLVGRTKPTKMDETYSVFKADEIKWETMEKTYDKNFEKSLKDSKKNIGNRMRCFFRKLQAEMFDVVNDRLRAVRIRVKYSVEAENELRQLFQSRLKQWEDFEKEMSAVDVSRRDKVHNLPELTYLDNDGQKVDLQNPERSVAYIEYSDNIRGIGNFANYLRRFGNAVEVTEGQELMKVMKEGANRALLYYVW